MRSLLPLFLLLTFLLSAVTPAIIGQELSGGDLLPRLASEPAPSSGGTAEALPGAESTPAATQSTNTPGEPGPLSFGAIVLAMLIGGLILLFVEVALIPGFGLTGVTGILVIIAGLGLAFWKLDIRLAVLYSFGSMAALIGLILWAIYIFPHTSVGKKFVLETKISIEDGYTATRDLERYVGMEGIATSDLRPSGIARIGDERLDVLSDGEFVPRQSRIKVLRVRNGALIVGAIETPPAA
ncbi:MAG TPA: NfeD family protein [Candidatus Ozemobacteraceae bacterium]|nr:NfeD family protein [Candidatus Ozemobacteraceae bacterium]